MADPAGEERLARLNDLLERLEDAPDGELGRAAVGALGQVYGAALANLLACAEAHGVPAAAFTADPLVGHLLALHGLHPDPAEVRIRTALAELPAELVGIDGAVAHVRVAASGCAAAAAVRTAEEAVLAAAPELAEVAVRTAAPTAPLIPVDSLRRAGTRT